VRVRAQVRAPAQARVQVQAPVQARVRVRVQGLVQEPGPAQVQAA
jgi:hypothetical protein